MASHTPMTKHHLAVPLFLMCALAGLAAANDTIAAEVTSPREYRDFVLSTPRPDYPIKARRDHITGSGIAELEVDRATGQVTRVRMALSTRSALLDQAAMSAFQNWRFKPGSIARVRIPISFTMPGGGVSYDVQQKPVDDVSRATLAQGVSLLREFQFTHHFTRGRSRKGRVSTNCTSALMAKSTRC
jgi:TonB family protein